MQHEEMRRRKRRSRLNLTACYHACDGDCNHGLTPPPPKNAQPPVTLKPKSWFQQYAELNLVETEATNLEVNAVPKAGQDVDYEIITVTVDSGAYNTVGPPKTGTYFDLTPTEASARGRHYLMAFGLSRHRAWLVGESALGWLMGSRNGALRSRPSFPLSSSSPLFLHPAVLRHVGGSVGVLAE